MQDTRGLLRTFRHHPTLPITLNESCKVDVPHDLLQIFMQPHKLGYYYFVFMDEGTSTYHADDQDIKLTDSQMICGFPNQIFHNSPKAKSNKYNNLGFDDDLLTLLPRQYAFLHNPLNTNLITFDPEAKLRIKTIFNILFQLLHTSGKEKNTEIIVSYMNILLTEANQAYFHGDDKVLVSNSRLSKFIAFKLAVETHLTDQIDIRSMAENLSVSTSGLYDIVKEFSGISPKEWVTNRLIREAQHRLLHSNMSVKELAYNLGFNDPGYFSRLFKKNTGTTVTAYLAARHDLSHK